MSIRLGFGIEIEAYAEPNSTGRNQVPLTQTEWREKLAKALQRNGLKAEHNKQLPGQHRKNPDRYDKGWWITVDGSLRPIEGKNFITFEAVSPKIQAKEDFGTHIRTFWRTTRDMFTIQQVDCNSAGTHVHVAPVNRYFTLPELQTIAFAIVQNEALIQHILPHERRSHNQYCVPNSYPTISPDLHYALRNDVGTSLENVATKIKATTRKLDLCRFMQGKQRFALWNFENTHYWNKERQKECTGTIEFRGGRHMRGPHRTLRWIVFVLAFVSLALEENKLNIERKRIAPTVTNIRSLWTRIRAAAAEILSYRNLCDYLPEHYEQMNETRY